MKKNWLTTLFGLLAGVPAILHTSGVNIGHLGSGDWLSFISGIGMLGIGAAAKDSNVSGGTVPQPSSPEVVDASKTPSAPSSGKTL